MTHIALVGCGSIGKKYAAILSKKENVSLSFCDTDTSNLESCKALGGESCSVYPSLQGLIQASPDKVIIATPASSHLDIARQFLEIGSDILIEKPVSYSLSDAIAFEEETEGYSGTINVVSNMRYHPCVQLIKEQLDMVGHIYSFQCYFQHRLGQMRPAGYDVGYVDDPDQGGVILDCIHEIDYLQWLFGPLVLKHAFLTTLGHELKNAEDYACIQVQAAHNKVRGIINFDFLNRLKSRGIVVTGENGTLSWELRGKSPETNVVKFSTNDEEKILYESDQDDSLLMYDYMLSHFLNNTGHTQTLSEAVSALKLALSARGFGANIGAEA